MDLSEVEKDRAARLLFQLPVKSRVMCKVDPTRQWGWQEILANKANYLLEILAWQKTKDATKRNPTKMPKPFVPDFIQREINKEKEANSTAMDIDDLKAFLNKPRKKV